MTSPLTCGLLEVSWPSSTQVTPCSQAKMRWNSLPASWRFATCHRQGFWRVQHVSKCSSTPMATLVWCRILEARQGGLVQKTCRWFCEPRMLSLWTSCRAAYNGCPASDFHLRTLFSMTGSLRVMHDTRLDEKRVQVSSKRHHRRRLDGAPAALHRLDHTKARRPGTSGESARPSPSLLTRLCQQPQSTVEIQAPLFSLRLSPVARAYQPV
mmetsp:Transcript_36976/g.73183  ORF Transcript_36976/g.73183 Transcript_36976/m.73183 type:complete len:211 (-) Transcript_36976:353-985(-)